MQSRALRSLIVYTVLLFAFMAGYKYFSKQSAQTEAYTYAEFREDLEKNQVKSVTIRPNSQVPTGQVSAVLQSGTTRTFFDTDVDAIRDELIASYPEVELTVSNVASEGLFLTTYLPIIIAAVMFLFMLFMMRGGAGGSNAQMMNFGKSRAQIADASSNRVTFRDVAGLEEEKQDLEEIVDFLKNPGKYTKTGARIPKGVILVGPPGTGKTLIGKAVAGEAGVPFFSISGSDFVEMFVGVGASRVRDLFEDAKKHRPCIVFIDEIDAVARRRGAGLGGGHDEREQTLNQLLVEMDGFGVNEGIIVMAATNRVDILDPAILRPGRFDRKVAVGMPDVKAREEILKVHSGGKPLGDDVDLKQIAQTTAGFSGADLENLLNEAAINAAKAGRAYILQDDIRAAFVKVGIGAEKRSKVISERDKRITAYHEAGHAILFHLLPDVGPVYSVSIIPTGLGAAGYTMPLPEKDEIFSTRGRMLQDITVCLGGRVAEELIFDDVTTGASQDLKTATATAREMVTKYGFSRKLGLVSYDESGEIFVGRDYEKTKSFSENTAAEIDSEVKAIIDSCYHEARRLIVSHRDVLEACADLLVEREKIGREEFEALFHPETETPSAEDEEERAGNSSGPSYEEEQGEILIGRGLEETLQEVLADPVTETEQTDGFSATESGAEQDDSPLEPEEALLPEESGEAPSEPEEV